MPKILSLLITIFTFLSILTNSVSASAATAKVEVNNGREIVGIKGEGFGRFTASIQYRNPYTGASITQAQIIYDINSGGCTINPRQKQFKIEGDTFNLTSTCNPDPSESPQAWQIQMDLDKIPPEGTILLFNDDNNQTPLISAQDLSNPLPGSVQILNVTVSTQEDLVNDTPHNVTISWQPAIDTDNQPKRYNISSLAFNPPELPEKSCTTVICSTTATIPTNAPAGANIPITVTMVGNAQVRGTTTIEIQSAAVQNFCNNSQISASTYIPDQETLLLDISANDRVDITQVNISPTAKIADCNLGEAVAAGIQQQIQISTGGFLAKSSHKFSSATNECIEQKISNSSNQAEFYVNSDLQARLSAKDSDGGGVTPPIVTCSRSVFNNRTKVTKAVNVQVPVPVPAPAGGTGGAPAPIFPGTPNNCNPQQKNCTVSAGQRCNLENNNPAGFVQGSNGTLLYFDSKTGAAISDQNLGLYTAIGCLPTHPTTLIQGIFRYSLAAGGGIALLLMIWGVFLMITSAGNPDMLKQGNERLTNAVVGLLVIIFSTLLLQIIGVDILNLPGFIK